MARKRTRHAPKPRVSTRKDALETQARLLDAAGRLFAAKGYELTNIREICRAADVNIAAVRHHFGSKEGLYRAVVVQSHQGFLAQDPFPGFERGEDPAEALGRAIEQMLRIMLVQRAGHPYAGQLIAREMRAPTPVLDELIEHVMKPLRVELEKIVAALLGEANTPRLRGQCTNFVIGLCVFHDLGKEALKRFGYPPPSRAADVPRLAKLITRFALAGIVGLRDGE